jgi:hypothetical protein
LSSSSFEFFGSWKKTKGSYSNDSMTLSIRNILCVYILSLFSYLLQTFPISFWIMSYIASHHISTFFSSIDNASNFT